MSELDGLIRAPGLAHFLARRIFEAPQHVTKDAVQRIAFKGRPDPNNGEWDFGGLCEEALADVIKRALEEYKA